MHLAFKKSTLQHIIFRRLSYEQCYRILGIRETDDQQKIREAYIELVKKVHPDSGLPEASDAQFKKVNEAFKKLQKKHADDWQHTDKGELKEKDFGIRHTTPQHRAFLTYSDVEAGSPMEREKQHHKRKAINAQENIFQHRLKKLQAQEEGVQLHKSEAYRVKIYKLTKKAGIESMVEDLILESISKGDLEKLPGWGKPLNKKQQENPYLDFTTQKLNQILIDNGFTPEWITLQKDIRNVINKLKNSLSLTMETHIKDTEDYNKLMRQHEFEIKEINKMIDKYNLIVPILDKQMFHIKLCNLLSDLPKDLDKKAQAKKLQKENEVMAAKATAATQQKDIFSFIFSIF